MGAEVARVPGHLAASRPPARPPPVLATLHRPGWTPEALSLQGSVCSWLGPVLQGGCSPSPALRRLFTCFRRWFFTRHALCKCPVLLRGLSPLSLSQKSASACAWACFWCPLLSCGPAGLSAHREHAVLVAAARHCLAIRGGSRPCSSVLLSSELFGPSQVFCVSA